MEEIMTALKHQNEKELMDKIKNFEEKMDAKQKEVFELEKSLGIRIQQKEEAHMEDKKEGSQGVLV